MQPLPSHLLSVTGLCPFGMSKSGYIAIVREKPQRHRPDLPTCAAAGYLGPPLAWGLVPEADAGLTRSPHMAAPIRDAPGPVEWGVCAGRPRAMPMAGRPRSWREQRAISPSSPRHIIPTSRAKRRWARVLAPGKSGDFCANLIPSLSRLSGFAPLPRARRGQQRGGGETTLGPGWTPIRTQPLEAVRFVLAYCICERVSPPVAHCP